MKQPLKWHGGKHYLAQQLIALMPPHIHYVEPYAGGLAVLLAKQYAGISEVVTDLNGGLTNFWRVLQDEGLFRKFRRQVQAVPFSEVEWQDAKEHVEKMSTGAASAEPLPRLSRSGKADVEDAVHFFVLCRQSLAGRCEGFATLSRNRTRRGMNEQASAWLAAVDGLAEVHARLRRVVVLNRPALEVIRPQDGPETLFYLDPPYVPDSKVSKVFGPHEMTTEQHEELLDAIVRVQGKVMISGYASRLYDTRLAGWSRHAFRLPNSAASGVMKRDMTEIVWCNFPPIAKESADAMIITPHGSVRCLYDEAIDLGTLGPPTILRASHVEPDQQGRWWADLAPVQGPRLGPFQRRTEALAAERTWLEGNWLDPRLADVTA